MKLQNNQWRLIPKAFSIIGLLFISIIAFPFAAYSQKPQQPSIMIIPSDNHLKRLGCLEDTLLSQGQQIFIQHYRRAFTKDAKLKFVISAIQAKFADRGFPLEDMEQTLKQIQNEEARDLVDGKMEDMRAKLLRTARPDIALELTYEMINNGMGNILVFNIQAIDTYTNKVISSIAHPGLETIETHVEALLAEQVEVNIQNLQSKMQNHFDDLAANGRIISLRITVQDGGSLDFSSICEAEDEEYKYVLHDWIKRNALGRQFSRRLNTDAELLYSDIRIPMFDEEGFPVAAMDWIRKFRKHLRKKYKIQSKDLSTGLGGGALMVIFE